MSASFVTPWTVAHQAPLSMGISQSRIPQWVVIFFSRGFSQPRDKPMSPAWQADSLPLNHPGSLILDSSHLLCISLANIFSQFVPCLLILFTLNFTEQKFLMLMKSAYQWFISSSTSLLLHLKSHQNTQGHLGFLLSYLLRVLPLCILHLGLWTILSQFFWRV